MCPSALREQAGQFVDPLAGILAVEELFDRFAQLGNGLFGLVRQDQGLVVDFLDGFSFHDAQNGCRRPVAKLGIDRPEHRVVAHGDLVGRQGDQRAARHRIVWDKHRDLPPVVANRPGNLQRREHQAAGRLEDQVEGHLGIGHVNRADHVFRILDVDIADDRETQQAHRLLAMHQEDHP